MLNASFLNLIIQIIRIWRKICVEVKDSVLPPDFVIKFWELDYYTEEGFELGYNIELEHKRFLTPSDS